MAYFERSMGALVRERGYGVWEDSVGKDVVAVQIDGRHLEVGWHFHPFLQSSEQIDDRVAQASPPSFWNTAFSGFSLACWEMKHAHSKNSAARCARTVEIAPRLPEPVAASLGHWRK